MSTIDLIVLGILKSKSMNAMEIAKFVTNTGVDKLVKISTPAVYKSCKRLYKSEKLDGITVREGEMPEKVIYSLNESGEKYFHELMVNYSTSIHPMYFEFNSFLWNIHNLEYDEAIEMLTDLQKNIKQVCIWISAHENELNTNRPENSIESFSAKSIVKQYRMILHTLSTWIDETIEEYKIVKKEER